MEFLATFAVKLIWYNMRAPVVVTKALLLLFISRRRGMMRSG